MKQRYWLEILLASVILVWAGNYTIGKFGMKDFSPAAFTALRFAAAGPLLLALLIWEERTLKIRMREIPSLLLIALLGVAVYQTAFIAAVKYAPVASLSLAMGVSPIVTALFGALSGQEPLKGSVLSGALAAFAGLFIVLHFGPAANAASAGLSMGDGIALIAGFLWGLYPVLCKPLLNQHSALWVTTHTSWIGAVLLMAYSWQDIETIAWSQISVAAWASLAYSTIPVTVIGLVIWYYGIGKIGANHTMIYMYMMTPLSIAIAAATIHEPVNLMQGVGTIVAMAGVVWAKKELFIRRRLVS